MSNATLEKKMVLWKHGLLDITKKNRMLNYRRTKRTSLQLLPEAQETEEAFLLRLYDQIAVRENVVSMQKRQEIQSHRKLEAVFDLMKRAGNPVCIRQGQQGFAMELDEGQKTLKALRSRARLAAGEQGIHILYLCFGFLEWKLSGKDPHPVRSPLILVPVSLACRQLGAPYQLSRAEEDIVLNPTLVYALESIYHFHLPEFDPGKTSLDAFLQQAENAAAPFGWRILREVDLSLLSFLKIVMYRDMEENEEAILSHPVIRSFGGEKLPDAPELALLPYPHDDENPVDSCTVLPADASQLDAVWLSRKGCSFVLQGPPGTGKSQTITNIIAQALSDGKKVLFVSEKLAALQVVDHRMRECGLDEYCLSLHNYKADKKKVLRELSQALDQAEEDGAVSMESLYARIRQSRLQLGSYARLLHRTIEPIHLSIYEAFGKLQAMEELPLCFLEEDTVHISRDLFEARLLMLQSPHILREGKRAANSPWQGTVLTGLPFGARERLLYIIKEALEELGRDLAGLEDLPVSEVASAMDGRVQAEGWKHLAQASRQLVLKRKEEAAAEGIVPPDREDAAKLRGFLDAAGALVPAAQSARAELFRACGVPSEQCGALAPVTEQMPKWYLPREERIASVISRWDGLMEKIQSLPEAKEALQARRKAYLSLLSDGENIRQTVLAEYREEIFSLDISGLLGRFRTDYRSWFRFLNPRYAQDRAQLSALRRRQTGDLRDEDALSVLGLVKTALEMEQKARGELSGELVSGLSWGTWWQAEEEMKSLVLEALQAEGIPEAKTLCGVLNPESLSQISEKWSSLLSQLRRWNVVLGECGHLMDALPEPGSKRWSTAQRQLALADELSENREMIERMEEQGRRCLRRYEALTEKQRGILQGGAAKPSGIFAPDGVGAAPENPLAEELTGFSAVPAMEEARRRVEALHDTDWLKHLHEFLALFEKGMFDHLRLAEVRGRMEECRRMEELEQVCHFTQLRRRAQESGIGQFLDWAMEELPEDADLSRIYQKAFVYKWLIDQMAREPWSAVQMFSAEQADSMVSSLTADSQILFEQSRRLLRDSLNHERAALCVRADTAHVRLLRREAAKKSRVIPLRVLFREMPELLQAIKPCFMMSPLSVAYFLDQQRYQFDLVIFDEASQILTEDAIGAIVRGKQVIIAGDSRQMPPTSFFNSVVRTRDDELDPEDEDEDEEAWEDEENLESVLDEAETMMPVSMLLWHYRSRDESLIAFSNENIYHSRLITFPNSTRKSDCGIRYLYLPDGLYEGGGKNRNLREAEKCVELLEQHIQQHPGRSLGIIAFSEKQQATIEDAVTRFRMNHPQYESFFDEDKEEPFFVKNLENVQGDERDVIIFSICYGKNAAGKMYMRFGPLGGPGGERRLNVAVTRAKYQVFLVGSILPGDIDPGRTQAEGVLLLRAYIAYAMQGGVLPGKSGRGTSRDDFADGVEAFLKQQGFRTARNVGASRCRVDLAVLAPGSNENFIAGIECDGTNYLQGRTAYDRDVGRPRMMREIGWRMIHLWSAAWIRSPEAEKQKLLAFLAKCVLGGGSA